MRLTYSAKQHAYHLQQDALLGTAEFTESYLCGTVMAKSCCRDRSVLTVLKTCISMPCDTDGLNIMEGADSSNAAKEGKHSRYKRRCCSVSNVKSVSMEEGDEDSIVG